jgi:hypothetical protein
MILSVGAVITVGAAADRFVINWLALHAARRMEVKHADKYFHCMANCESAKRGPTPKVGAILIGNFKEAWDLATKNFGLEDSLRDEAANAWGRQCTAEKPCNQHCSPLLSGWLPRR